jgi:hypothetical protein
MYNYRIESEEGKIVVYVDLDSNTIIHQPFNPEEEGFTDWSSNEQAESWAIEKINTFNSPIDPQEKVELE